MDRLVLTGIFVVVFRLKEGQLESSLYTALERAGNRPVRALQRQRAVLFTAEQTNLLQAHEKDRGDIYGFVAELSTTT